METFSLGRCRGCGKHTALKNGFCAECKKDGSLNNLFEDFFPSDNMEIGKFNDIFSPFKL